MKYLCMCYYDTVAFGKLSAEDFAFIGEACKPHDAALRASGKMTHQGSLSMPETWKTIRTVDGKPVVTEGPLSSSHEQIGAFFVVEAKDMDEALRVAALHAGVQLGKHFGGGIEVRACDMFEQY